MTSRPVEVGDLFVRRTFAVLIGLCALAFACRLHFASDEEIQQWAAARDLSTHSFTPARSTARELVQTNPDSDLNWLLFAEACAGLKLTEEALDAYGHVSPEQPELHTVALAGQGSRLLADGQMRAAEPFLKKAFQRSPNNLNVAGELAFLMRVQGRVWESTAPVRQLLIGSRFRGDEIHMLGSQLLQVSDEVYTNRSLTRNPDDPLPLLGKARLHLHNNELQQAQELISRILPVSTDILEVQAMQGWLLNEKGQDPQLLDWHANLPSRADDHPEIWFVRGQFLMRHGRPEESARCFLESLARSPNHYEATYRLSQVLTTLGQTEAAMYAGRRAQELAKVELAINELARGQTFEFMQKAVNQLARVQRYWEAAALCEIVRWLIPQEAAWARTQLRKYCPLIKDDHSFRPGWIPVPGIALQDFPLPDWSSSPDHMAPPSRESVETPLISFTENARDAGIDFSYFSGSPVSKGLGHIFETTGGGVAVLDLDADHWPDLWFAQGNAIWNDDTSGDWSDRIYRNHDGAHFTDVTELCRVQESNFSQGISVGDYDSDGFPDVYVGNVGPNCFFRNNGDGTFTEIAQQAGIAGNEWTLSPAIVDLNQDGHPEVYCVNYLQIEQVLARRCSRNGQPLTCAPSLFDAEQDRLYQNAGNGSFTDVTDDSGIVCPDGKGLSLIAADVEREGRISLFVGNDSTNNFYFRNRSQPGAAPSFSEEAMLTGLACDGRGRAQATMGIAADDMNSDGLLDFFITNFYADPNTLYLADASGTFADRTRELDLYDASYSLLGFGSQCLDADLDGRPDLVITNGHVDRSEATGEPDWMRPQFFWNAGTQFVEMHADELGSFFSDRFLGRALTRLDWNRDGRPDFCVCNLYHPVSLVTNTSRNTGNYLTLRLVGLTVDRDAIGTRILVEAGDDQWVHQLVAGDGYASSNDRVLTIGIAGHRKVDRLTVTWTSNTSNTFEQIPSNTSVTIIQGSPEYVNSQHTSAR